MNKNENQNQQPEPAKKESEGEKILDVLKTVGEDTLDVVGGVALAVAETPVKIALGPIVKD